MRTTEQYIKEKGRYFEAEAKVSMREGFNKAYVTHTSKGFDTEPTEAEAIEAIEKDYPHLKVERIRYSCRCGQAVCRLRASTSR